MNALRLYCSFLFLELTQKTVVVFRMGTILLLFLFSGNLKAQTVKADSIKERPVSVVDTVFAPKKTKQDPRRASLLSAIIPGAGQAYNHKYWKLPILYGGIFLLGYYINFNHQEYLIYRDAYLIRQSGGEDVFLGRYSTDQVVQQREYWRRNRDLLIIISAITYLLNIADASVDAHLSEFDVSDNLSMSIKPRLDVYSNRTFAGIGLVVSLH